MAGLARRLEGVALDELVCNAGVLRDDRLDDVDLADVRELLEVNAIGALRVVKALHRNVRRGGKIALMTSRMGSIGDNGSGGYCAYRMSKAALNAAGMSLARDLEAGGIAVAILHPGYVRTEMTEGSGNIDPADAAKQLVERIDQLRPGDDRHVLARQRPGPALVRASASPRISPLLRFASASSRCRSARSPVRWRHRRMRLTISRRSSWPYQPWSLLQGARRPPDRARCLSPRRCSAATADTGAA